MIGLMTSIALVASAQAYAPAPDAPEARRAAQEFGACVADRSQAKADATLRMDFTTSAYRQALLNLTRANESCLRNVRMRSGGLLLAGAVAERLLVKQGEPVNVMLAKAATRPSPGTRTPGDRIAMCVVRSVPDDVAKLFAAPVASDEENAAAQALALPVRLCSEGGPLLEATTEGLRAMLATAAYRSVSTGEAGN